MVYKKLIEKALFARTLAYAPYSNYYVGAALITNGGKIYTGCNIENSAFPVTNCAERTALFNAVSNGEKSFSAIAVVGGLYADKAPRAYAYPCGLCRQALLEFCKGDFNIIVAISTDDYKAYTLSQLMPAPAPIS